MRTRLRYFSLLAAVFLLLTKVGCRQHEYRISGEKTPSQSADSGWLDAVGERILPLVEKHDTQYAPSYREDVFRALALGISKAEVIRLLGPPLRAKQFPDGNVCWYYTRHGELFASYFVRVLEFDRRGVLIARRHYFYLG